RKTAIKRTNRLFKRADVPPASAKTERRLIHGGVYMSMRRHWTITSSLAAFALIGVAPAVQAAFPDKPVRIIVPFAPGGSTDIIARLVGERMGKELGQPFVIENKGGAGGAIGATDAARAKPDGYTLSIATVSTMAVVPACTPNLSYDPIKDFQPVTNFAHTANVLAVNPKVDVKDIKTFIESAKASPGKYSFASSGEIGRASCRERL